MNSEIKAISFLESLDADAISALIQKLTREYLHRWPKPIVQHSFSKQITGESIEGPWLDTLDDFRSQIRRARAEPGMEKKICQCQWHLRDSLADQYWWIRVHFSPVPNLEFSANDLRSNIGGEGVGWQETALKSMVAERIVGLAVTKSQYVGRLLTIYLYFKLGYRRMLTLNIYVQRDDIEPRAVVQAVASLKALLENMDADDEVQLVPFASLGNSIKRIDAVVKANTDICKQWIGSFGCDVEEWLSIR